ncbi:glycine cleavage system protein GcvH [Streptomyces sp. NPDC126514]|uniref:glycine cleavage system protein GcvH n=1 Tax=Streptomyces sp. NPDC126514 TaxID=3155210 RepID=UPI0033307847
MAHNPSDRKYTKDHAWVRQLGNGEVEIGITDVTQRQMGVMVFVERPKVGSSFATGEPMAMVESVKVASEIYTPAGGTVLAINDLLDGDPECLNHEPYGDGWIVRIKITDPKELDGLMSAAEYEKYISEE